jgi:hypothetical protein
MATPIIEQIALKIKARLEAITTANGYEITIASVIRPLRIDETMATNNQIYLTQETPTRNAELSCPGNPAKHAWDQPFRIAIGLRPSETATTPLDTLRNTAQADIQKALAQPTSGDWSQWDGLAIRSELGTSEWYLDDDGSTAGIQMVLTVTYRIPENDPYTLGG